MLGGILRGGRGSHTAHACIASHVSYSGSESESSPLCPSNKEAAEAQMPAEPISRALQQGVH